MTAVSAGHIIVTPTQSVRRGCHLWGSKPRPSHQDSRALPTELPCPAKELWIWRDSWIPLKLMGIQTRGKIRTQKNP